MLIMLITEYVLINGQKRDKEAKACIQRKQASACSYMCTESERCEVSFLCDDQFNTCVTSVMLAV